MYLQNTVFKWMFRTVSPANILNFDMRELLFCKARLFVDEKALGTSYAFVAPQTALLARWACTTILKISKNGSENI